MTQAKNRLLSRTALIHIEDVGPVLLERSTRAKHVNLTVKPFKGVRVAVPRGLSFKKAEQIARSKTDWLKKHLKKIQKFEQEYEAAPEVKIDRKEAREILTARLEALGQKYGYTYNRVSIRNQKTRWGSCSSTNNISLNMKLTLLPDTLRDFIILHELVHTRVKNHGKEFWAEITKAEPRARELARQVSQHSISLLK